MKILLLLALGGPLLGCAASPLPAGATCEDISECDEGLECLPFATLSGNTCETVGTMCSIPCQNNDSCAPLGSEFMCFATCDSAMTCGPTG